VNPLDKGGITYIDYKDTAPGRAEDSASRLNLGYVFCSLVQHLRPRPARFDCNWRNAATNSPPPAPPTGR
jgi:hypothetical protein